MRRTKPQNEAIQETDKGQIALNFWSDSMWPGQRLSLWLITCGTRHTGYMLTVRNVMVEAVSSASLFPAPQTEQELVDKLEKHQWYHKLKRQREIRGWSRAHIAEGI